MKAILKKLSISAILIIFSGNLKAQENFKGKYFAGFEAGANMSDNSPYNEVSAQGGVATEYFFTNHWSVSAKIKYHQTNFNYSKNEVITNTSPSGGMSDENQKFLNYQSTDLVIPINLKWNIRLFKPIYGSINVGLTANYALSSRYEYSPNVEIKNIKIFVGYNLGFGFHLNLKQNILYANYDYFHGASLADKNNFSGKNNIAPVNHHISIGYMWQFQ